MQKFRIYISCPIPVPQSKVDDFAKVILKMGADVDFWVRGTDYNTLALDRADAVVVLLEGNKWKQSLDSIPRGTKGEIASAYARDIPIYLGYRNGNNDNAIYESQGINNGWFEGIAGTSNRLLTRILEWEEATTGKSYAERKYEQVQAERERNEKAREKKSQEEHLQYLKDKGFDPFELKEPKAGDFKWYEDYITAHEKWKVVRKQAEEKALRPEVQFDPFGEPVVDAGGKLPMCHSKSQSLSDPIKVLNAGIYGKPPPIMSQMHDHYMDVVASHQYELNRLLSAHKLTPSVFPEEQLTKRAEEIKAAHMNAGKPNVMDHLSFVLGTSTTATSSGKTVCTTPKPPIVFGTPGQVIITGTGGGIKGMLEGFKDKFGVPASANDAFVEHLRERVKAPAPKGWDYTTKSSVMDKLKSKNK